MQAQTNNKPQSDLTKNITEKSMNFAFETTIKPTNDKKQWQLPTLREESEEITQSGGISSVEDLSTFS